MKTTIILALKFTVLLSLSTLNTKAQTLKELREAAKALGGDKGNKKDSQNENTSNTSQTTEKESSSAVSLEFDHKKNQLQYAQEFLGTDGTIYELERNYSAGTYYATGKKAKKSDVFKLNEKSGKDYETKIEGSPSIAINTNDDPETYYTNYDKGPSAWIRWSDKNKVKENHGVGKKFTEQQALDYSGYVFFDGIAFYGSYNRMDNGTRYSTDWPMYIWVTDKKIAKDLNKKVIEEKLKDYLVKGENEPDGFIKSLANSLAAADKAQNSINGKKVKSLAIKPSKGETKIPLVGSIYIAFEATLEDGTVMSTANKAYFDDYEITAKGASYSNTGEFKLISNSGNLVNFVAEDLVDQLIITIKSKFHPNLAPATIKLPVDYNVSRVTFNYAGSTAPQVRKAGILAHMEVKQIKNSVDGTPLLEYRMRYRDEANWHQCIRIKPETTMFFNNDGADQIFKSDGHGRNGGDGGDLTLVIDPSVQNYKVEYTARAGKGQIPKYQGYSPGQMGREGKMTERKEKVSW